MLIDRIDHLVLTVADIDQTVDFYVRVLGMEPVTFGGGRRALRFGRHKLNLHQAGREFEPKALKPAPTNMLAHSGATPRMKLPSGVKLSGPLIICLTPTVSSAGTRAIAWLMCCSKWS